MASWPPWHAAAKRLILEVLERVLSHLLGIAAAVGCHWYTLRKFAQRNEVHASDHELHQSRAVQ
jgi:hypothetical protein